MILAFDTYYFDNQAKTVAVQFKNWTENTVEQVYEETLSGINEYVSGEFYKRELPCILSLLKQIELSNCEAIIIDGFVFLNDKNKKGLGAYLYEALENKIPVIGVAKNDFKELKEQKIAVCRGESKKPLYITSAGISLCIASKYIENLGGNYRIPDILKEVDTLGRKL